MNQTLCVITGDIVNSRGLSNDELDRVMNALAAGAQTVRGWMTTESRPLERARGDGWQFAFAEPRWALRTALLLRAAIRSAVEASDTRLAIGMGRGEFGERLSSSSGSAFERSGDALEALGTRQRWITTDAFDTPCANRLGGGLVRLCDALSQTWTARQAEVFALRVRPDTPTMDAIASRLDVTQQTVQAHLRRAQADALLDACIAFEQCRFVP